MIQQRIPMSHFELEYCYEQDFIVAQVATLEDCKLLLHLYLLNQCFSSKAFLFLD
jgi:hypothetical protein